MYAEHCDAGSCDDGLDEYRGLGLVPLVAGALATDTGQSIVKSIGGTIVSGVSNLFGGGPDDTPSGWEQEALTGGVRCPDGGEFIYDYLDPSRRIAGHPGYRKGERYRVDVAALEAALEQTPQGMPGDPMFTREALIGAIRGTNPSVPRPRSLRELANAAAYIAQGKGDCKIGSSESPVAEHIDAILSRYRVSSATLSSPEVDLASPFELVATEAGTLPELGTIARKNPAVVLGAIGAAAVLGSILARSFR